MPTLFLLEQIIPVTITLPQAASIFNVPYFDDDAVISSGDASAALGGYHYTYEVGDTFITLPQACSIFGVPYLDTSAAISGADAAQIMGGYRYNYSGSLQPQPDNGEATGAGGRFRRGNKKRYYRELERLLRPIEPPKPRAPHVEPIERSWTYMGDNVVDTKEEILHRSGVDWLAMVPGAGMSDEQKRRIALAYLMLE